MDRALCISPIACFALKGVYYSAVTWTKYSCLKSTVGTRSIRVIFSTSISINETVEKTDPRLFLLFSVTFVLFVHFKVRFQFCPTVCLKKKVSIKTT